MAAILQDFSESASSTFSYWLTTDPENPTQLTDPYLTDMHTGITSDPLNFTTFDLFNFTTIAPDNVTNIREKRLYAAYTAMVTLNSVFITFVMGAGVTLSQLVDNLKKPVGPAIGTVCQVFIMPALCFGYALLLDLDRGIAVGMIITGSCPGGALSNIFTSWSRGDLNTSVSMTVISTTLALGSMPLNFFIYTRRWNDGEMTDVPYLNMFFSMLFTWVAAALGFLVAWKAPKAAKILSKIGGFLGFVFMIAVGVLQSQVYPQLFVLDAAGWAGPLSMPIIGCIIGFALASAFCLKLKQKRAIAYEVGTQNVAVALTVIAFTYDQDEASEYSPVPMIYAFSQIVIGLGSSLIHQIYYRTKEAKFPFKTCIENRRQAVAEIADIGPGAVGQTSDHETSLTDIGYPNLAYAYSEYAVTDSSAVTVDMNPNPGGPCLNDGTSTSPPRVSVLSASQDYSLEPIDFDLFSPK